jgi:hypothetical protein
MDTLDKDCAAGFLESCYPPCLSLYQPTHRHHPDNQQNPTRFRDLVKMLEESLWQQFPNDEIGPLLEPFLALADNREFWDHTRDGLAVLGARGLFRVYKLQRSVAERVIVAESLHIKPLLRIRQAADRYQLIGLNRQGIRFFEGNRDTLDEIEPSWNVPRTMDQVLGEGLAELHQTGASGGGGEKAAEFDIAAQHFFQAVDRGVWEHHSQPSGLPLILAALPEHHRMFHQISHNPFLLPESIDIHPDALLPPDELRRRAWQLVEPRYQARLAALMEEFGEARAKGLGDDDLTEVARAVMAGRIATLLIEASREVPGRIDSISGDITFGDRADPGVDDVLDDLGALTLKRGGQVVVIPAERMPTETGLAAIYHY